VSLLVIVTCLVYVCRPILSLVNPSASVSKELSLNEDLID